MAKIQLEIDSCNKCPKARRHNEWSSDGWDRMTNILCTEAKKDTGVCVDVGCSVPVPDWCPLRVDAPTPEPNPINLRERTETALQENANKKQKMIAGEVEDFFEAMKSIADEGLSEGEYNAGNSPLSEEAKEIIKSRGVKLEIISYFKKGCFHYKAAW